MERTRFDDYPCPIARAANIFGDWWVPLLMREAMYGVETFNEFQDNLGISKNILNRRLSRLVDEGIFQKDLYQKPSRYRYILTEKGKEALSILAANVAMVLLACGILLRFVQRGHCYRLCSPSSAEERAGLKGGEEARGGSQGGVQFTIEPEEAHL